MRKKLHEAYEVLTQSEVGRDDVTFAAEGYAQILFDGRPDGAEFVVNSRRIILCVRDAVDDTVPHAKSRPCGEYIEARLQQNLRAKWHEAKVARELLHRLTGLDQNRVLESSALRTYFRVAYDTGPSARPTEAVVARERVLATSALDELQNVFFGVTRESIQSAYLPRSVAHWERANGIKNG